MKKIYKKIPLLFFIIFVIFDLFFIANSFYKEKTQKLFYQSFENLETERLILSFAQRDDLEDIEKSMSEEIAKNLGGGAKWPYTKKESEKWFKKSLDARKYNHYYNYVIREKETRDFVGIITPFVKQYSSCLFPGKISYWAVEEKRRKGYISEALKEVEKLYPKFFNLQKIWTSVRVDNPTSSNLLKKSGFKETGSRFEVYNNNEYVLEQIYEKDL